MRLKNSFILFPGIGEKTEKKLWKNGITRWEEIEQADNIGESKKDRITEIAEKAEKNLQVGNTLFFEEKLPSKSHWRLYRDFNENTCFFDIETTGLDQKRNKVTTVSFYRGGQEKTLVSGKDLNRENLQKEIFESDLLVSFNGKRFDQPFLEHNFNLDFETPHIDLMYPCKRLGLTGGLKKIEKKLGINRELEDIDGKKAIRLWKKYEKNGDEKALRKLIKYNRYDAKNLKNVLEDVHNRLTKKFYHKHLPEQHKSF